MQLLSPVYSLLIVILSLVANAISVLEKNNARSDTSSESLGSNGEEKSCEQKGCKANYSINKNGVRVIMNEELEEKTGKDGSEIWLSILGDVYDVTKGKQHYSGGSYKAFAGTDCSSCFVSGKFTEDEAKVNPNELTDKQLSGILNWVKFYASHKTYKFIGHLADTRYYSIDGQPTKNLIEIRTRIEAYEAAKKTKD